MNSLYPLHFVQKNTPSFVNTALLPSQFDLIKKETPEYGVGIYALHPFARGTLIGHFLAQPASELCQHSLQRGPGDHIEDPYFVGYLLHSCDPNVVVDMHQQKVFCLKDIHEGEPLFMDYASTEDALFKQFACACEAPNCRGWITGRHEAVNAQGKLHLAEKERALLALTAAVHHVGVLS